MKKWVKILLSLAAIATLAVTLVLYFTAGMVDTADAFFMAVKEKDMVKARTYLAEGFKANTNDKVLTEFLSSNALSNVKESSWSDRQVNDDGRGELNGSITTEAGGVVPIKMTFVKENEAWKIYAIEKPAAGLQIESTASSGSVSSGSTLPDKVQQTAMVKQAMHDFLISVAKKDMTHFRSTVSTLWQKQFTVEMLNQGFKEIIDSDANWGVLENENPVLTSEVKPDKDGVIVLAGYYSTKPSQVKFEQKYIYEGNAWKLISLSVEASPSTETSSSSMPDKTQQNKMVKQSMHDFLVSVAKKDMTHFRSTVSALWQEQFTVEKFNATYKAISDSDGDWTVLEKVEPVLTSEVKPDENGIITLTGYYPTKPNQVQFEQKYIYEDNAWKLVGFNIEAK